MNKPQKPNMNHMSKPQNMKKTLKRLWGYLSKYKAILVLVLFCLVVTNITSLYSTKLIGVAIDKFISHTSIKSTFTTLIIMVVLYILSAIFTWLQTILLINIAQKTVSEIRTDIFKKLQKLPLNYFDTRTNGETMSIVINSVDSIGNALNSSFTIL